jgi:tetratricopeptide (TPR) repeat protein
MPALRPAVIAAVSSARRRQTSYDMKLGDTLQRTCRQMSRYLWIIRVALLALAASLASGGRPASAHDGLAERIAALSAQIAQSPSSPSLLVKRAELYRENRQWNEALADLDRAERIDPTIAIVNLVRAHVHLERKNWQAAADAATRFISRQPDHADARVVRARAYAELGRRQAAAADFTSALAVRPQPDLYIERAKALEGPGHDALEQALRSLDEGLARLGQIVTLELGAIDLELRLNRYDAALARLDGITARAPRKDTWLARRGAILERAGRPEDARAAYRAALDSLSSQSARIQQTRASVTLADELRADIGRLDRTPVAVSARQKRSR